VSATEEAKVRAATTYNTASDFFDHPANSFWDRFGRRSVERLHLSTGAHVLDVCCGSGASAIPAAEKVGPDGIVIGVDLAENLLDLGRAKAKERGLGNIEFRTGDMLALGFPDESFDAVICVFGIFFVPDIAAGVRELWRLVRPGGLLAVTNWGPRLFEPANTAFWEAVRAVRPDLYKGFNPWDLICEPESLRAVLAEGGVFTDDVVAESGTHHLSSPDDWWRLIMGSGFRGTVEQLSPEDQARVREANMSYIRDEGVSEIETNVVYAIAYKER